MDDKYRIPKKRKPETKQEVLQEQIEELVKRRDGLKSPAEKEKINAEITKLFAEWQRLKL